MTELIVPAPIAVPERQLDDLRARLALTRWPEAETVRDWSQGAPLARVQALCAYWRDRYDWRRCEAMLNGWNPHRTVLDGLGVHFFHVRSPEPDALPLLMTHGWPGSVLEFHKVVGPLTDPARHGGRWDLPRFDGGRVAQWPACLSNMAGLMKSSAEWRWMGL